MGNGTRRLRRLSSLPRWARIGLAVAGVVVLAAGGAELARAVGGPTADFTYSPTSPTVGQTIDFSNFSETDPTSTLDTLDYQWDFGDDSPTGTDPDPSHVYTATGTYTVTLTANEVHNSTTTVANDTATQVIDVGASTTQPVDDGPYPTEQGAPLTVDAPGVLANDQLRGSTVLPETNADTENGGTVTLNADGSFTYTPPAATSGADFFTYHARDALGNDIGSAEVSIHILGPIVDGYSTAQNTPLTVDAPGVLADDQLNDPRIQAAQPFSGATQAGGTVVLSSQGGFTYTPPADYVGEDSFTYTAVNGNNAPLGTATVLFGVTGVEADDDGPIAVSATDVTTVTDSVLSNDEGGVLAGSAALVHNAEFGTVDLHADGTFTYTPEVAGAYTGPDSFTYTTTVGGVQSNVATVRLTVQGSAPTPPPNDDLANAVLIQGLSGSDTGDNTNATLEPGETNDLEAADAITGKTIWWKWTAPASGRYEFDTAHSTIDDSTLAVYTGSQDDVAGLTEVTSDDDSFAFGLLSQVIFDAVADTTYYIAVGAYDDSDGGRITLNWSQNVAPANDDIEQAEGLEADSGSAVGTTVGATPAESDPLICDCNIGGTVWYSWSTEHSGPTTFDISEADAVGIYTGQPGSLEQVVQAHNGQSPEVVFDAQADTQYWIQVAAFPNDEAAFVISWQLSSTPANDDFRNAAPLGGDSGVGTLGTTVAASLEDIEPNPTDCSCFNNSVWYAYTPSVNGTLSMQYTSDIDGSLALYSGTAIGELEQLDSDWDSTDLGIQASVQAGVTYYVQVASTEEGAGTFSLDWNLDSTRSIAGFVSDANGEAAGQVTVRACLNGSCATTTSDGEGDFRIEGLQAGQYTVEALPSQSTSLAAQTTADTTYGNVTEVTLRLTAVATSGGAAGPTGFQLFYPNCPSGTLTYTLGAGGSQIASGSANGDGNGHYAIDAPANVLGHHAALELTTTLTCNGNSAPQTQTAVLYTDPSGIVVDDGAGGARLAGATVTLLHQDLTPVQPGDSSLSPATPANPETTDSAGSWGWDVSNGTYVVFAEKDGCGSTTSSPVTVSQGNPQSGIVLHLNCSTVTTPPVTTTTPAPPVTTTTITPPPLPPPTPGVNVNVVPVIGNVIVNGQPLKAGEQIPLGATIDATNGIIGLTTIGTTGQQQTMYFFNAAFVITQAPDGATLITLQGGDFDVCTAPKRHTSAVGAKPKPKPKPAPKAKPKVPTTVVRSLWGEGKGSFRTQGRYSAATVRGTMWLTEDRCDGTYTKVLEGVVDVFDQVNNKHLTVIAGHSVIVHPKS